MANSPRHLTMVCHKHGCLSLDRKKKEKTRDNIRIFSFLLLVGLDYCLTAFVHTNAMLVLNGK